MLELSYITEISSAHYLACFFPYLSRERKTLEVWEWNAILCLLWQLYICQCFCFLVHCQIRAYIYFVSWANHCITCFFSLCSSQYSSMHSRLTNKGHKAPWSHRLLRHRHVEPNKWVLYMGGGTHHMPPSMLSFNELLNSVFLALSPQGICVYFFKKYICIRYHNHILKLYSTKLLQVCIGSYPLLFFALLSRIMQMLMTKLNKICERNKKSTP